MALYAGDRGEIRIAASSSHRPLPTAISPQTAAAIAALWKSMHAHVEREHDAFGEAAGLRRAGPGSKGDA